MSQSQSFREGNSRRSNNFSKDRRNNNFKPRYSRDNDGFGGRGGGFGRGGGRRGSRRKPKKENNINTDLYTQKANRDIQETKKSSLKFSDLGINPKLVKTIEDRGFTNPTQIQEAIIPKMIVGKDVIGVSQTGGGKTGAYLIPILNQYANNKVSVDQHQTLIIVPTRELAYQIEKELYDFDIKQLRLWPLICIGGTDMRRQMSQARKTNQFVIGTPGRLTDMINRGAINLQKVHTIILDEMDRMLDMGFIDEITDILQNLPANVQKGFFSATLNKKIKPTLDKFAGGVEITQINHPKPSEFVDQSMIKLAREDKKTEVLVDLLKQEKNKSIIFVNTKSETEFVYNHLKQQGFVTDYIHGDRPQGARTRIIKQYRSISDAILVATDVAARGLDIDDITHVINYDEPHSEEDYIHRIGRTGRAGRFGKAVTFVRR